MSWAGGLLGSVDLCEDVVSLGAVWKDALPLVMELLGAGAS